MKMTVELSLPSKPWYYYFGDLRRSIIIELSRLRLGQNQLPPLKSMHRIVVCPPPHCLFHSSDPQPRKRNHLSFLNCPNLHAL